MGSMQNIRIESRKCLKENTKENILFCAKIHKAVGS